MGADSTDEYNVAELRAYLRRKHIMESLEDLLGGRLSADHFVTICFRAVPGGFVCEITDAAVTWVGSGATMRAAYDSANSRQVSK